MSRALGAAFLNHQVEQLEKSVSATGPTQNWRQPRNSPARNIVDSNRNTSQIHKPRGAPAGISIAKKNDFKGLESERQKETAKVEKDADVVVVDASVLVHGIGQLKKWCRDGRQEVVIIPLEVLNTLDLLKKGTTTLAQRARTASRILEAQVGTNPRIRVQRDDAFVLWDNIPFKDGLGATLSSSAPEWVRRMICCARWEVEHVQEEVSTPNPKLVLAVLTTPQDVLADGTNAVSASPVPLPAPQINRHEPRSSGTLVTQWATKAGIEVFEIPSHSTTGPVTTGHSNKEGSWGRRSGEQRRSSEYGRKSPEEDRGGRRVPGPQSGFNGGGRGRRNSYMRGDRVPSPSAGLVERPPAVMAMMEAVAQPTRVVRVLARGEKLDPDP